ncbi:hypothetical protein EW026_g6127 [Hermanssonia centrifuga]|uniref:Uncharacterized protein n=1 Tax=Hermanssonia centrifuga TaxID=98765 RepID=A0A4S4KBY1_9APHY|nr:hypothetical protein EW026_g6127 [Hermanssonia centrifuga]
MNQRHSNVATFCGKKSFCLPQVQNPSACSSLSILPKKAHLEGCQADPLAPRTLVSSTIKNLFTPNKGKGSDSGPPSLEVLSAQVQVPAAPTATRKPVIKKQGLFSKKKSNTDDFESATSVETDDAASTTDASIAIPSTKKWCICSMASLASSTATGAIKVAANEDINGQGSTATYKQMKQDVAEEQHNHMRRSTCDDDERTRDVCTIFKPDIRVLENGNKEKGHWCRVCWDQGAKMENTWFMGGVSSLRTHIKRKWLTHGGTYIAKCKAWGLMPNYTAVPKATVGEADDEDRLSATLDGFIKKVPKWLRQDLLDHIIELIVSDNQDLPGQVLITFDVWTSKSYDPYLAVTAHYIDSMPDKPAEWVLQSQVIGFTVIEGDHSGANTAAVIICMLDRYGLLDKVFVQAICPNPAFRKQSGNVNSLSDNDDGGNDDDDEWLNMDDLPDDDDKEAVNFEPGDLLGKILALINQVQASSQAKAYFAKVCGEEAQYDPEFVLLPYISKQIPKLRNKKYSDFAISNTEWEQLRLIYEVLDEPQATQAAFSSEKYSTVWRTIPTLECLQEHWEIMVKEPKFAKISFAIEAGLEKLQKWYKAVDDSAMYFICLGVYTVYSQGYLLTAFSS